MKVLIAGNMGYIGPMVTRQFRREHPDATLIGFDIGYFAHCLTNARVLPEARLDEQFFGDVRTFPAELLEGVDAVIYLAAISNDPMGNAYEAVTLDINQKACIDIATRARAAGAASFVFASSCSVYGYAENGARTENSPVDPLTAYARSKVAAEQGLASLADSKFKVTCLRFATACGMSPRLRLDLVVNDFVASAVASKQITILSDGTPWRPLIHVHDMARAMDWAVHRESRDSGDFLVVNTGVDSWNYQVKTLAEAVARIIPGVEVSINQNAAPDKRSYQVDFGLFKNLAPNHQPQYDLDMTIRELKAALEEMNFADQGFRTSQLMRLVTLSGLRNKNLLTEDLRWSNS
jgi:nucleoside-diphosphate-sugar epimerase